MRGRRCLLAAFRHLSTVTSLQTNCATPTVKGRVLYCQRPLRKKEYGTQGSGKSSESAIRTPMAPQMLQDTVSGSTTPALPDPHSLSLLVDP